MDCRKRYVKTASNGCRIYRVMEPEPVGLIQYVVYKDREIVRESWYEKDKWTVKRSLEDMIQKVEKQEI